MILRSLLALFILAILVPSGFSFMEPTDHPPGIEFLSDDFSQGLGSTDLQMEVKPQVCIPQTAEPNYAQNEVLTNIVFIHTDQGKEILKHPLHRSELVNKCKYNTNEYFVDEITYYPLRT